MKKIGALVLLHILLFTSCATTYDKELFFLSGELTTLYTKLHTIQDPSKPISPLPPFNGSIKEINAQIKAFNQYTKQLPGINTIQFPTMYRLDDKNLDRLNDYLRIAVNKLWFLQRSKKFEHMSELLDALPSLPKSLSPFPTNATTKEKIYDQIKYLNARFEQIPGIEALSTDPTLDNIDRKLAELECLIGKDELTSKKTIISQPIVPVINQNEESSKIKPYLGKNNWAVFIGM